jgi:hypothetical protein
MYVFISNPHCKSRFHRYNKQNYYDSALIFSVTMHHKMAIDIWDRNGACHDTVYVNDYYVTPQGI